MGIGNKSDSFMSVMLCCSSDLNQSIVVAFWPLLHSLTLLVIPNFVFCFLDSFKDIILYVSLNFNNFRYIGKTSQKMHIYYTDA